MVKKEKFKLENWEPAFLGLISGISIRCLFISWAFIIPLITSIILIKFRLNRVWEGRD